MRIGAANLNELTAAGNLKCMVDQYDRIDGVGNCIKRIWGKEDVPINMELQRIIPAELKFAVVSFFISLFSSNHSTERSLRSGLDSLMVFHFQALSHFLICFSRDNGGLT
jgi:hypothetical protein